MFDQSTLRKLETALDEMLATRTEYERKLAAADEYIAHLREILNGLTALSTEEHKPGNQETSSSPREDVKLIRNMAYQVFEQSSREMSREEILQALLDRGVIVGGKDVLSNLSAHLSHDERFAPVKGKRGYWMLKRWVGAPHRETVINTASGPRRVLDPFHFVGAGLAPSEDTPEDFQDTNAGTQPRRFASLSEIEDGESPTDPEETNDVPF